MFASVDGFRVPVSQLSFWLCLAISIWRCVGRLDALPDPKLLPPSLGFMLYGFRGVMLGALRDRGIKEIGTSPRGINKQKKLPNFTSVILIFSLISVRLPVLILKIILRELRRV